MADHELKSKWRSPYVIRRGIYLAIAVIAFIAAGAGFITEAQSDTYLAQADSILTVLAGLGLLGAAAKSNPGSDMSTSEVAKARAALKSAQSTPGKGDDVLAEARLAAAILAEARDKYTTTTTATNTPAAPAVEDTVTAPPYTGLPVYNGTSTNS